MTAVVILRKLTKTYFITLGFTDGMSLNVEFEITPQNHSDNRLYTTGPVAFAGFC